MDTVRLDKFFRVQEDIMNTKEKMDINNILLELRNELHRYSDIVQDSETETGEGCFRTTTYRFHGATNTPEDCKGMYIVHMRNGIVKAIVKAK